MGPTSVYGARAEKPLQNADFAMKQTNICRLSGDIMNKNKSKLTQNVPLKYLHKNEIVSTDRCDPFEGKKSLFLCCCGSFKCLVFLQQRLDSIQSVLEKNIIIIITYTGPFKGGSEV